MPEETGGRKPFLCGLASPGLDLLIGCRKAVSAGTALLRTCCLYFQQRAQSGKYNRGISVS
jgi:hypothetical protein